MTVRDRSYQEHEAEERRKTLIRSVFIGNDPSATEILSLPKAWVEQIYGDVVLYGPQYREVLAMEKVFTEAAQSDELNEILWGQYGKLVRRVHETR